MLFAQYFSRLNVIVSGYERVVFRQRPRSKDATVGFGKMMKHRHNFLFELNIAKYVLFSKFWEFLLAGEQNKGFYHLMTELPQERLAIAGLAGEKGVISEVLLRLLITFQI